MRSSHPHVGTPGRAPGPLITVDCGDAPIRAMLLERFTNGEQPHTRTHHLKG
jgi:hypothetical protein